MPALKLIQDVLLCLAVLSALVLAFWVFPRLFLASYSDPIWQSIRRHPVVHVVWGVVGLAAAYLLFKMTSPAGC